MLCIWDKPVPMGLPHCLLCVWWAYFVCSLCGFVFSCLWHLESSCDKLGLQGMCVQAGARYLMQDAHIQSELVQVH